MQESLQALLAHYRLLEMYYHACHNLVAGPNFFSDHKAFSDFYEAMSGSYDRLAERGIGELGASAIDLMKQVSYINDHMPIPEAGGDAHDMFFTGLSEENALCDQLHRLFNEVESEGFRNIIADLIEQSEVRQYMIAQRIK